VSSSVLFPTVVVDDFFTDPDDVVKFGHSLELRDYEVGFPGRRTHNLNKTHSSFAKALMQKIFSVYFSDPSKISCETPSIKFQLIPKFSENKEDFRNTGWVHKDVTTVRNKLAGVIYLTPNAQLETGTSIVKVKKGCESYLDGYNKLDSNQLPMSSWFVEHKAQKGVPLKHEREKVAKDKEKWNGYFEPVTVVGNIYNRIILFDGNEFHCANKYHHEDEGERFIIVFFFNNVKGDILPRRRIYKDNLTELINASGSVY
tara:strand:+ start:662 stop:1435 length:774 start_codon:yes stop_codon:yes gene_type:complete